jgi:ATP-dependent Clp protease ATP-binding subunit ClpC
LLGILREETCVAAEILHKRGLRLNLIREELARSLMLRRSGVVPDGS